jgi:uncharacterized membrane protein (UPF0182 family)
LRLVVLALQDKLAYGPTFDDALASLYGGEASSVRGAEAASAVAVAPKKLSQATDLKTLIAEAGKDFAEYERLTAEGKLGAAGQKLDELKRVLDRLNAGQK